jgi:aminoglycoside phosphotransferase family enzyme/predicted kinase
MRDASSEPMQTRAAEFRDVKSRAVKRQEALIHALRRPTAYADAVDQVDILETHISYVLLSGRYAYKIKKAVELGFLDYRSLTARHRYCKEELRLNRRLAPDIYLDVVPITGPVASARVEGDGRALEFAVKMRQFPQDSLLSQMLLRGALTPGHIDALAARVAEFHGSISVASAQGPFGRPDEVRRLALENFEQLDGLMENDADRTMLVALREWTEREYNARAGDFEARRQNGSVRECHGDLHLNNIALVDGRITVFDCIEFNDQMRWGDIMGEVAFVTMDLDDRKRSDLAFRFLNAYLEKTGDYAGLAVLRFLLAYRAMVRAKVTWLRAAQLAEASQKSSALDEYRGYVKLAQQYARTPQPAIVLMHGLAGSGKTTVSQQLLEDIGAIRIRSDVERKRLHGIDARGRSQSSVDDGLYASSKTEQTYQHVVALARQVTAAGYVAIVDAASLKRWQRDAVRNLAMELGVPFVIVSLSASGATLRQRVAARSGSGIDASEADLTVLDHQERTQEPIEEDEQLFVVTLTSEEPRDSVSVVSAWRNLCGRLGRSEAETYSSRNAVMGSTSEARRAGM